MKEPSTEGSTDAVILGAGVIGLTCAYYLLREGWSVRLVDIGPVGGGSSGCNLGMVTPSHAPPLALPGTVPRALKWMLDGSSPFYVKPTLRPSTLLWFCRFASRCNPRDMMASMVGRAALLNSSRALYDELIQRHDLDCEWETRGLLLVYREEREMRAFEPMEERLAGIGLGSTSYHGTALRELEPALREDVYGARFYAMDAHLRPERWIEELRRVVEELGASVEERCSVERIATRGDTVQAVRTERGEFRARLYVLATGAWSSPVARALRLKIPILPGKGYTITVRRPDLCPTHPCLFKERNMAVTPWRSGFRLGGTMEFAGYDRQLNRARIQAILDGAGEYLKDAGIDGEREYWYGWRPMTSDGMPFIGRSPRHANLMVAAGHNMLGLSMAPATGKLVAEIATGSSPHIDPEPYRLERA